MKKENFENEEPSFAERFEHDPRLREYVEKSTEVWMREQKGELTHDVARVQMKKLDDAYRPKRSFREWLQDNL